MVKRKTKRTSKRSYAIGSGDYMDVYKPINPVEEIVGGKVVFRHSSGNKSKKRINRRR